MRVVLDSLMVVGVLRDYSVLVFLCVHSDLVFYIRSSGCLMSRLLGMALCSGLDMVVHKLFF